MIPTTIPTNSVIALSLLLLLSSLAKEHIPTAAFTLAILSALHKIRLQQNRTEKLEDEYRGQRNINRAAAERHRTAYLALQQSLPRVVNGSAACWRAHYERPSAKMARDNRRRSTALPADAERQDAAIEYLQDTVRTLHNHNAALRREVEGMRGTAEKAREQHCEDSSSMGAASDATERGVRLTKQKRRSLLWQPPSPHVVRSGLWSM
jgi:predicted  nucleic acid-binding Zn-ribbon protein